MERKDFIKNCGLACLGGIGISTLLESCSSLQILTGQIAGDDLVVPLSDFVKNANKKQFKRYIIINNDQLKFPICVYRFNESTYTALWMQCTHQGAELQVFGDKLQCPAHGSEFNNKGIMQNGPAATNLRTFAIAVDKDQLKISLKAI
ncbi:QcrA and Rieske domain-containing protein [Pedobacter nyackensis]|uniref:Ferredoxin subunit of nitrite reductase or a ring-hydroxylating dioxygenase n=1 Tax=Pedobacter nyackensis TaxID=475255 RepID=A0A1W2EZQ2_9SPHI|nr:Rieske 2Fe-2S domain-containing protein [Pedobacter nyackensis]SMD15134.1 Ferredoxin subunit of nitrite reductase or a ring-hydroxylating dioxygenase [Pedobacter nyackensis]